MLNKFYKNISIREYLKRYGLINAIKRGVFTKQKFYFVQDYEMRKVLWQCKITKKLNKYVMYKENFLKEIKFNEDIKVNNPIWIYWDSGIEKAPKIVKSCYKSIIKNVSTEVILLNKENIEKYIILPNWIKKKLKSGGLPVAHYTDILRLALLYKYGGTWIDATVYITGKIQKEVLESDFFALRNSFCLLNNPALFAVWFIHANPKNIIIEDTLNASLAYWNKKNHIEEYLMTNIIMTMVINKHGLSKSIYYSGTDYSEYLMRCLGDIYNKEKMDWIKNLTNIHKLSYKLDKDIDKFDSFYKHIVEESK